MSRTARKTVVALVTCVMAVTAAGAASAARPRPKPVPAPLPAPAAPVVGAVLVNESNSARVTFTNAFEPGVDWVATISGPSLPSDSPYGASGPRASVDAAGVANLTLLVPDSTYVLTVRRHRFFDPGTNQVANLLSAPTQVTVRTLTLAASQPSTPVIARTRSTSTAEIISWAPSTDNTSATTEIAYIYSVVGDPQRAAVPTCFQYCFGATGTAVTRPGPGTSIRITVTAIDAAGVRSLPSNELVISG